jgi:hypothetical protein
VDSGQQRRCHLQVARDVSEVEHALAKWRQRGQAWPRRGANEGDGSAAMAASSSFSPQRSEFSAAFGDGPWQLGAPRPTA